MTDWAAHRAEFPALATHAYLNTAAGAPMSKAAAAAGRQYYEATERDGDVHWDDWLASVEAVRAAAANLLLASPGEIAFVQNASAAMNMVAARLKSRGDVVLVRGDFPSVTYPWMVQGHGVVFAEPAAKAAARRAGRGLARGSPVDRLLGAGQQGLQQDTGLTSVPDRPADE